MIGPGSDKKIIKTADEIFYLQFSIMWKDYYIFLQFSMLLSLSSYVCMYVFVFVILFVVSSLPFTLDNFPKRSHVSGNSLCYMLSTNLLQSFYLWSHLNVIFNISNNGKDYWKVVIGQDHTNQAYKSTALVVELLTRIWGCKMSLIL